MNIPTAYRCPGQQCPAGYAALGVQVHSIDGLDEGREAHGPDLVKQLVCWLRHGGIRLLFLVPFPPHRRLGVPSFSAPGGAEARGGSWSESKTGNLGPY